MNSGLAPRMGFAANYADAGEPANAHIERRRRGRSGKPTLPIWVQNQVWEVTAVQQDSVS